jgi:metallo-beta-lactamase class B
MSASLAFLLAAQQIVIPLQKPPPQVERPIAPIEMAGPAYAAACEDDDDWDKRAPPVRIHGNTYFVGTCGISSILITGSAGHILIDSGTEKGADLVADNIRRLGFRLQDVKYLLHSHEHVDHVGGMARLQQLTGARLVASPEAARVLQTGTASADDPQSGMHAPFPAARVDRIVHDGEQVRIGNVVLTAVTTPGHTPGALTWRWGSCDGGVCRSIVYADSLTPVSRDNYRFRDHPAYLSEFRRSIAKVGGLDCEILLTPHPSASDMRDRFAIGRTLLDPNGCRAYAAKLATRLDERLAKEAAAR